MQMQHLRWSLFTALFSLLAFTTAAHAELNTSEAYCTIRSATGRLDCLWVEKDVRRRMTSQDISNFIDQARISAYITVKSRNGLERLFLVDPEAPAFKRLATIEKSAAVSDIIKAKSELFTEIESRLVKLSDTLDEQAASAELVKYDPSVAVDHAKLKQKDLVEEVEGYRKTDTKYQKEQHAAGAGVTGGIASTSLMSKHRVTFAYENVGYSGNFSRGSSMRFNSVDNMAALLNYRLALSRWNIEAEAEYYTAYSNYNKGSSGSPAFTGTDSSSPAYVGTIRGNYCYQVGTSTQVCPGVDVIYDMFPVMSFKTLNVTGTTPLTTSVLEMQAVTDVTVAPTVSVNLPLYRELYLNNRVGYLYGTGLLAANPNKVKSNQGFYLATTAEWPMWQGFALSFGVEYLARTTQFERPATNAPTTIVTVDNTGLSALTTRVGVTWLWGDR